MNRAEHKELEQLMSVLLDGVPNEIQQQRLRELLERDEEARKSYLKYQALHADLAAQRQPDSPIVAQPSVRTANIAWSSVWIGLAVGLVLVIGWSIWNLDDVEPSVAQLTSSSGAVWVTDTRAPTAGMNLRKGDLELEEGIAQLTMTSGAKITLAAPAKLQLIDDRSVKLIHGHLAIQVPPQGIGFRVLTPSADVVDLGTEFSIAVDGDGGTEVHVRQGVVIARPNAGEAVVPILGQEAGRIDADHGDVLSIPFNPNRFAERDIEPASELIRPTPARQPLPPGSRILFLGDKVTDRETHVLLVNQAIGALPVDEQPDIFNMGESMLLKFTEHDFQQQVTPLNVTHAVLEFGPEIAAQHARWPWSKEEFAAAITRLVGRLEKEGIEPILETGFPLSIDDPVADKRLDEYNAFLRKLAAERGYRLADVESQFRSSEQGWRNLLVPNGDQPSFDGSVAMAAAVLKAIGHAELRIPDELKLLLLPGTIVEWEYCHVPNDTALTTERIERESDNWEFQRLTLPQPPDRFSLRVPNHMHSIVHRDRARGFATRLFKRQKHLVARTVLGSLEKRTAYLNVGARVSQIWLNGKRIFNKAAEPGWHAGRIRLPIELVAGQNEIYLNARQSFFISVTDRIDWPLPR